MSRVLGSFILAVPSSLLGFFLVRVLVVTRAQEVGLLKVGFDQLWMLHALTLLVPLASLTTYYALARDVRCVLRRFAVVFAVEWLVIAGYLWFAYIFLDTPGVIWLPGLGSVQRESAGYLVVAILGSLALAGLSALLVVQLSRRVKEVST